MSESEVYASPLAALHTEGGATLATWERWAIPARYQGVDAEVSACRAGAALFDLAQIGAVSITGEDCRRFLNGMFTNNLRRLQAGGGSRSALADIKGRLIAIADVYCTAQEPDAFLVLLEGRDTRWLLDRLDRYIIMDDVALEDAGAGASVLSVQGPDAAALLRGLGTPAPAEGLVHGDGVVVMARDRTGLGGFDLLVDGDRLAQTWTSLCHAGGAPAGIEALEALRIRAGKPRFPVDVGERRFAHELLLRDELLAFDKGCYLGQEVINRMDTMGRINKRLAGLRLSGVHAIQGAEVRCDGEVVGAVTSASVLGGESFGLAVLRNRAIDTGRVSLVLDGGASLSAAVTSPPFAGE